LITLRNLTIRRGDKLLLDDASAAFVPGARVGVVGANGCGKSTLFSVFAGEMHTDGGDLDMPPRLAMSRVQQEIESTDAIAIEFVLDGDPEYRTAEAEIAAAEATDDGLRMATAHEKFQAIDGWAARARAASILDGLGFAVPDHTRPVGEFSGGWRMRISLARALVRKADLLLLDEPTNHLDLDAVMWLERWLAAFRGTLFLISHDRELLDGTATEILHFDGGKLKQYTGNYAEFESQRAMALSQQTAAFKRQQREIEKLHSFVDRFRAKASKAKQAQSRLKALERMERIAPAHVDSPFTFSFREAPGSPDPVLQLEDCRAGYGDRAIIDSVSLSIQQGARFGLLGRNGAGKSTLIQLIAGRLAPLSGSPPDARREGKGLRIGYFAQHQLEALDMQASPLLHLLRLNPRVREQELRDYLGGFAFPGDVALEPVARLSGGEKARLALALLIWQRPNLLLLDEPTNHLDIDMREALTEALQEYSGALVLVSHDRHLLRTTCDAFLLVADGQVVPYDGDLDDYRQALASRRPTADDRAPKGQSRKDERREAAQAREAQTREKRQIEKQIKKIEAEMTRVSAEQSRVDGLLSAPDFYGDGSSDAVRKTLADRARVIAAMEKLEAEWLDMQTQIEAVPN